MIDRSHTRANNGLVLTFPYISGNNDVPATFEFWMAHVARDLLQLGVHFRALAIMCQIPGGGSYQPLEYGRGQPLSENDRPCFWLRNTDHQTRLSVLAECLRRLDAHGMFDRIRGTGDYYRHELSGKWKAYLGRHAKVKDGLLTIVAFCIDILVVEPGLKEIDAESHTTWWKRWWLQPQE